MIEEKPHTEGIYLQHPKVTKEFLSRTKEKHSQIIRKIKTNQEKDWQKTSQFSLEKKPKMDIWRDAQDGEQTGKGQLKTHNERTLHTYQITQDLKNLIMPRYDVENGSS